MKDAQETTERSGQISRRDGGPGRSVSYLEELGEQIALLSAQQDASTYESLTWIREFDEDEGWFHAYSGFLTCANWLAWRTGLDIGAARQKVRVANALGRLPLISEEMRRGRLSYSKVRALTRIATPDNEEDLLVFAKDGTASHVERLVRAYRSVERRINLDETEVQHASRYCHTYTDDDGMIVIRARLEPKTGTTPSSVSRFSRGCSARQATHQEAKKLISRTSPLSSSLARPRGRPMTGGRSNSGTGLSSITEGISLGFRVRPAARAVATAANSATGRMYFRFMPVGGSAFAKNGRGAARRCAICGRSGKPARRAS